MDQLVLKIDSILPQTQCEQCGHKGCLEYAKAIVSGEKINRCPPGGDDGTPDGDIPVPCGQVRRGDVPCGAQAWEHAVVAA